MEDLLFEAREEIRAADEEMAALFVRRMTAVKKVAAIKSALGLPITDEKQERRVIERGAKLVTDPELQDYYIRYIKNLMEISKSYQRALAETDAKDGESL